MTYSRNHRSRELAFSRFTVRSDRADHLKEVSQTQPPRVTSHTVLCARPPYARLDTGSPFSSPLCLGAQLAISVNNCPPPRDPRSRMTSFKRTQRKYVQKAYRVRNWREYERTTPATSIRRWRITVLISERRKPSGCLDARPNTKPASSPTGTRRGRRAGSQADNASTRTTPSRRRSPWGSPRSRESDRLARTHRWRRRPWPRRWDARSGRRVTPPGKRLEPACS